MRKDECRFTRSCSSSGNSVDLSNVAIAFGSDAGQESGVLCSAAVGEGLRVECDDAGRTSDSRRKRAPFVGVS